MQRLQRIAAALSSLLTADEVADVILAEVAPELGGASQASVVKETLVASIEEGKFCTMVLGMLTPDSMSGVELDVVCAGHPRPLVVRADGTVAAVGAGDPQIGVFPGARHDSDQVRLDPGDTFVLYTDGVVEARGAGTDGEGKRTFFETERLIALLGGLAGQPASQLVSAVETELMTFAGGRLADDVAIVALRAAP